MLLSKNPSLTKPAHDALFVGDLLCAHPAIVSQITAIPRIHEPIRSENNLVVPPWGTVAAKMSLAADHTPRRAATPRTTR